MDLSSASTYLNNLLAKSGLLKGGRDIPFHSPSSDDGSTTRIINLVHDLVERREKESEQLESLAITIRQLRSDNAKGLQSNEKLQSKYDELERKNALLESQAKAFNSTLRTSEASAKALKDEIARLKMVIQQVRTQSANDIRKRDVQIEKMKEKLLEPRRNSKSPNSITIPGVTTSTTSSTELTFSQNTCPSNCLGRDAADALTELSQTLANENDNLVSITRQMLSTLKSILGAEDDFQFPSEDQNPENDFISITPRSFDALSEQLQTALESLRDLVQQPNFVAREEIEARDKEIERLRARVETLEEEWMKAIALVDQWNKSMRGAGSIADTNRKVDTKRYTPSTGLEQILEEDEEEEQNSQAVWEHEGQEQGEQEEQEEQDEENEEAETVQDIEEDDVEEEAMEGEEQEMVDADRPEQGESYDEEEQEQLQPWEHGEVYEEEYAEETEIQVDRVIGSGEMVEALAGMDKNVLQMGDISLDEEQLLREASMVVEDMFEEEEGDDLEIETDTGKMRENLQLIQVSSQTPQQTPKKAQKKTPKKTQKPKAKQGATEDDSEETPKESPENDVFLALATSPQKRRLRSPKKLSEDVSDNPLSLPRITPTPKKKNRKQARFESPIAASPKPTTPRKKKVLFDSPEAGEQHAITTVKKAKRKKILESQEAEEPTTPKVITTKKRVLPETPETTLSTRASKRRKTPAVKRRAGRGNLTDDEIEDFSH